MIPSIGIMIGMYILTRYIEMGSRHTWPAKVGLMLTFILTFLIMWDLLHTTTGVTP